MARGRAYIIAALLLVLAIQAHAEERGASAGAATAALRRAVLSYGSGEALDRASTAMAEGSLRLSGRPEALGYTHFLLRDLGLRVEMSGKGGSLFWILTRGGNAGYSGGSVLGEVDELSEPRRHCLQLLMMSLDIAHVLRLVEARGSVRQLGMIGNLEALEIDPAWGYPPATVHISRETGLVVRVSVPGLGCQEFAGDTIVLGDHRPTTAGLVLPYLIEAYQGSRKLFEVTVQGYALGNPISPSIFRP